MNTEAWDGLSFIDGMIFGFMIAMFASWLAFLTYLFVV